MKYNKTVGDEIFNWRQIHIPHKVKYDIVLRESKLHRTFNFKRYEKALRIEYLKWIRQVENLYGTYPLV